MVKAKTDFTSQRIIKVTSLSWTSNLCFSSDQTHWPAGVHQDLEFVKVQIIPVLHSPSLALFDSNTDFERASFSNLFKKMHCRFEHHQKLLKMTKPLIPSMWQTFSVEQPGIHSSGSASHLILVAVQLSKRNMLKSQCYLWSKLLI